MNTATATSPFSDTKRKLLDAAMRLMLRQGFTATTVDQVCSEAGLTKGSFFHYFKSKDQIGQAAVSYFSCCQQEATDKAPFNQLEDPLDSILGMLDFFAEKATDPNGPKACLVGNLAQELAQTHPAIRGCCEESFNHWTKGIASLLRAAKEKHQPSSDFEPDSVATMMLSLIQGSLVVAKARQNPDVLVQNVKHFRSFIESLFGINKP